jgi:hypothetical protein
VERQDGHSWRPDRWSLVVRTGSGYVQTRVATNGRTVRILVRTRATCPHGSEAARVQTTLIHPPEGDPTGLINSWSLHILSTPPKSFLLAACELFLASFWLYLPISCLFVHFSHILGIFLVFSFEFTFKLLEYLCLLGMLVKFLRCIYLRCWGWLCSCFL